MNNSSFPAPIPLPLQIAELLHLILTFAVFDSLKALALVSRCFRIPAQSLLMRAVSVDFAPETGDALELLCAAESSPFLSLTIRSLTVRGTGNNFEMVDAALVDRVMDAMPNLQSVHITHAHVSISSLYRSAIRSRDTLHLSFSHCIPDYHAILQLFRSLVPSSSVSFIGIEPTHLSVLSRLPATRCSRLVLDHSPLFHLRPLRSGLALSGPPLSLPFLAVRHFQCAPHDSVTVAAIAESIFGNRKTLEELHMNVSRIRSCECMRLWSSVQLIICSLDTWLIVLGWLFPSVQECVALRTVTLIASVSASRTWGADFHNRPGIRCLDLQFIHNFLTTLPATTTVITVLLDFEPSAFERRQHVVFNIDWSRIHRYFAAFLPKLTQCTFTMRSPPGKENPSAWNAAFVEHVARCFPSFQARPGKLRTF